MKTNFQAVFFTVIFFALMATGLRAQNRAAVQIDPKPFADNSNHWYGIYDKNNVINPRPGKPRYQPKELAGIADNILLFQKSNGGWPKNYDIFAILTNDQKDSLLAVKNKLNTTYDNGSTYTQIAALSQVFEVTHIDKYKTAALRGFDFILASQYTNGGWPQYFPLEDNYSKHITYNDGVFAGIMELLKKVVDNQSPFGFLDDAYRQKLNAAFYEGINCIKQTQIVDDGTPTAWCQQHDEVTLAPAWARKFEPPSICNKESAELVLFLMSIRQPDKKLIGVIESAVIWFQQSAIKNTVIKVVPAPKLVTAVRVSTTDRVAVADSSAKPIWTRYYELKTHKPLFCNRDSKVVYSLAEVDRERRDGYAWYTYAPRQVLNRYPEWKKTHSN
jgi:PelA/Pel-15E family pectate lyase